MLKPIVFGKERKQAIRIERLLFATGVYLLALVVVYSCTVIGLIENRHAIPVLQAALVANVVFYGVIRSGANLRARDPSLTVPQLSIAMLTNSYLVLTAGSVRSAFLIGYLVILAFATLRLRPRQIVVTGAIAAVIYGGIIGFELVTQHIHGNLLEEVLQWLVLLLACPWFALIARHIHHDRHRLREKLALATREHEAALKSMQEQATRDELTGIFNRRCMGDALRQESSRTDRTHEPFCILMMDIDHFKDINDRVGHIGGDNALVAVTRTVAPQLRSIDHFSRYGGEEFVVLMPSTSLDAGLYAAERIRKCVEEAQFIEGGHRLDITLSIGVAEYRAGGSVDTVLGDADRALYRAKHNGRNCVECSRAPVATPQFGVRTA